MKFYSTRNKTRSYSAKDAINKGLASDSGLFMPESIPRLDSSFFANLKQKSFQEIAFKVSKQFFADEINDDELWKIIKDTYNFPCPIKQLEENLFVLELFHGPTLAFKDFGARFLARILASYRKDEDQLLTILVATSGDTGSAVATGFYKVPGIRVIILYPSKKVSPLQEQQLTTVGENITALEIQGTFDDCQRLVKEAFLDTDLLNNLELTSANSINIGRFIPQSFYYFSAAAQIKDSKKDILFSVPCGNLGNLTAGLFAKKMGLNISRLIAALNSNNVFEKYLETGIFEAKPSIKTIANAMDVGNPSNFERIYSLYNNDLSAIREDIKTASFQDDQIKNCIREVYSKYNYLLCPHTAVGYLGLGKFQSQYPNDTGIVLATAHPAKFINEVEPLIGKKIPLPTELKEVLLKKKKSILLDSEFKNLKEFLLTSK